MPTLALAAALLPCPLLQATTTTGGGGEHQLLREGWATKCNREPRSQAFPAPAASIPVSSPQPPPPSRARQKAEEQQQQPPALDCTFRVVAACFMVAEGKEGADREEEKGEEKQTED